MNSEDMALLSFYEEKATVSDKSNVFLVQHRETHRFYIKKILSIYDKELYLSLRDMNIYGIPKIYHIAEDDDKLVVIEEYINGSTLSSLISEHGPFSVRESVEILSSLCDILSNLHRCIPPIIHRDIKPSNILISPDKKISLIDFNASKKFDCQKNYDTYLMGTAEYAAPEQFGFSQSDERTDIYALGVLFNVLLTGCFPKDVLCSAPASEIVKKCMQMEPSRRYSSVMQLKAALNSMETRASKKQKHPFLPPGFRTLTWWKMIIALIIYPAVISVILALDKTPVVDKILLVAWFLFVIALVFNYMGIAGKFPFVKNKKTGIKVFGILLWSVAAFIFAVSLAVIFAVP